MNETIPGPLRVSIHGLFVLIAVPLMTVLQVILRGIPRLRPVYRLISA